MTREANTDHPIHELMVKCWSPYAFDDRPVSDSDLSSIFEAARWAASSFNEQPWRYIQEYSLKKLRKFVGSRRVLKS